jgi:hypothetical protein
MASDDWCLTIAGAVLVCVCRGGYRSPADVVQRMAEVACLAEALPLPWAQHAAAQPVILSGEASYDPAHLQEWKDAPAAVPPAGQQQMLAELRPAR